MPRWRTIFSSRHKKVLVRPERHAPVRPNHRRSVNSATAESKPLSSDDLWWVGLFVHLMVWAAALYLLYICWPAIVVGVLIAGVIIIFGG
ncbi:MAG: hypothetical protein FWG74_07605 [Planctomycetes bacterium]|nr:hypothetical protein [Planctomycetota bacterium]